MKNILRILFVFIFTISNAQSIEEVVSINSDLLVKMVYKDNFMYVSGEGSLIDNGKVYKVDISNPVPSLVIVADNLSHPYGLAFKNNDLYIAEYGANRISKIDITDPTQTVTTLTETTEFSGPISLSISGDYLYYSVNYDSIYKIDLLNPSSGPQLVIGGLLSVFDIEIINNELFYTDLFNISKIDITDSNPTPIIVVNLSMSEESLNLGQEDNYLYYSVRQQDNIEINKINILNNTSQLVLNLTNEGFTYIYGINLTNQCLYVTSANTQTNLLFKYCNSLNLDEYEFSSNELSIHPTSVKDYVIIKKLKKKSNVSIYNTAGILVLNDTINVNEKINLNHLKSGLYFIQIEEEMTFKFIKE
jgi:hypothetical protein